VVDPTEHFLFAANTLDNTLSGFTIAGTGALTLVPATPIAVGTSPMSLAFDSTGVYLYVANLNSTNVSAFSIDATTGTPTAIDSSPFSVVANPAFIVLAPSGKFLIIGSQSANTINEYTIDATTGKLTSAGLSVTLNAAPTSLSLAK
jgi:6-phosphogluconolactonase (cycloisomerase 2 family)